MLKALFINGGEVTTMLGVFTDTVKMEAVLNKQLELGMTDAEFAEWKALPEDERVDCPYTLEYGYLRHEQHDEAKPHMSYVYIHDDGYDWDQFTVLFTIVDLELDVEIDVEILS